MKRLESSAPDEVLPCPDCNRRPAASYMAGVMFECACGVMVPFPPAANRLRAAEAWNQRVTQLRERYGSSTP